MILGLINFDKLMFFSPVKLILLIGWFYACINSVKYVEYSRAIPEHLQLPVKLSALIFGPLVVFCVRVIEFFKKCLEGKTNYNSFFSEVFLGFFKSPPPSNAADNDQNKISLFDSSGRSFEEIYSSSKKENQVRGVIEITEKLIADAIDKRASDILIDPRSESSYSVRIRVDGVLRDYETFESQTAQAIVNSVKAISRMDIAERRRPQDGSFGAQVEKGKVSLRVASAGVLNGEKMSLRILNEAEGLINLKELGMSENQYTKMMNVVNQPSGMILICGPTGSGKSTTLYSILKSLDSSAKNIISVEDPVEYEIRNVSQIEVNAKADITFAKALRSVLRQDPDVICIGEIRDEETAKIALQASQTGHLVIATMHSNSNVSALIRLMDLGIPPMLLSSGLNMIVSQRLVRKLCSSCRSLETLSQEQIQKLGTRGVDYRNIFRAGGCMFCDHTGYKGRRGIYDIMVIDEKLRAAIMPGKLDEQAAVDYQQRNGKSNLKKEAMKKVLGGVTTWQEVKRVVSSL